MHPIDKLMKGTAAGRALKRNYVSQASARHAGLIKAADA